MLLGKQRRRANSLVTLTGVMGLAKSKLVPGANVPGKSDASCGSLIMDGSTATPFGMPAAIRCNPPFHSSSTAIVPWSVEIVRMPRSISGILRRKPDFFVGSHALPIRRVLLSTSRSVQRGARISLRRAPVATASATIGYMVVEDLQFWTFLLHPTRVPLPLQFQASPRMDFPLFTSIPPHSNYGPVIENWKSSGFSFVSVNCAEETQKIAGVQVIAVNGSEKKLPLSTILQAIEKSGAPFAGVINADCKFITRLDSESLRRDAASSIILAERIDVDSNGTPVPHRPYGFDAMIFDTSFIRKLKTNDAFRIGEPWWDFWLPYAFQEAGATIKKFDCPILIHEHHPTNWNRTSHTRLAHQFSAEFERFRTSINDDGQAAYQGLIDSPTVQSGIPEAAARLVRGIPVLIEDMQRSQQNKLRNWPPKIARLAVRGLRNLAH